MSENRVTKPRKSSRLWIITALVAVVIMGSQIYYSDQICYQKFSSFNRYWMDVKNAIGYSLYNRLPSHGNDWDPLINESLSKPMSGSTLLQFLPKNRFISSTPVTTYGWWFLFSDDYGRSLLLGLFL